MKNFKSTLQDAEKYFETSTNDMENIYIKRINSSNDIIENQHREKRNTISFPIKNEGLANARNNNNKKVRSTLSDRLNFARPTPLVVLSNAGSIIQAERYRNTFPGESLWNTEPTSIEKVPFVGDGLNSFDIFSPTGNTTRKDSGLKIKPKTGNKSGTNLLKISNTNNYKNNVKEKEQKKSAFCILL
jgi:hypothetical protein